LGKYSTISGNPPNIAGMVKDTTVTKEYGHFLPSVHLKITPVTWMDLRLSYAKTLKRPNYSEIVPTTRVETDQVALIDLGNGELNEMIANSYDASVSFYTGKYGLLSFGVFSKEFTDYITNVSYTIMPEEAAAMGLSKNAWEIRNKPINLPDKGYVKGFEVDIQTNFKYLPAPLNGIILNLNLTKLDSKTYVEKWWHEEYYDPVKRKVVINFETDYFYKEEVQLTSQIDMVMNSTLGYEHKGFSFRISAQYQGVDLSNTLNNQETEVSQRYNDDWLRFDLAMSQKILKKMKIRFNIANLSNVGERDYIYDPMYWRNDSRYGAVYQLGFEYNF
jgi:TonB-dependent receptor